jgi:sugar (pentulose or hexulose) kinase
VPAACADLIQTLDVTEPSPEDSADYDRLYPIYRQLYPALQATFHDLAAFEG